MPTLTAPEIALQPTQTDRDYSLFVSRAEAQRIERRLLVSPENKTVNAALRSICYLLHNLAQRHVPNTPETFSDYSDLRYCTKILQEMGFKPNLTPGFDADVSDVSLAVIHNTFEYRQLKNKILAALSVVADLTERPAAAGSKDFQRGVREGYRRASDIAILFLDDLS